MKKEASFFVKSFDKSYSIRLNNFIENLIINNFKEYKFLKNRILAVVPARGGSKKNTKKEPEKD